MATNEHSNWNTEAVDHSSIEASEAGSCTSHRDKEAESLWGTPGGPAERLPGESLPDYRNAARVSVSSGKRQVKR
jgi:hypothetical protein